MKSSASKDTCIAPPAANPTGFQHDNAVDELLNCFSEFDTETQDTESDRISFVAQLLEMRKTQHLNPSQLSNRRFVVNMLESLSASLKAGNGTATPGFNSENRFKYLVFLLKRSQLMHLAEKVEESSAASPLGHDEIIGIGKWMDAHGLELRELGMIQPGLFRPKANAPQTEQGLHDRFIPLLLATQSRGQDYLSDVFRGIDKPLNAGNWDAGQSSAMIGRGEALASIFEPTPDSRSMQQARLKAFFIPNRTGEPVIALSFTNDGK